MTKLLIVGLLLALPGCVTVYQTCRADENGSATCNGTGQARQAS